MTRDEFFEEFSMRLGYIPQQDFEKSAQYYDEMIGDRIEDGMPEEEAVAAMGNMDDIVSSILYDLNLPTLIKTQIKDSKAKSSNKTLWMVLAIVGVPLWLPLLAAFFAVVLAVYIVIWSMILVLYSVIFALGVACVCGILAGILACFVKSFPVGICVIGAALVCGALMLFAWKPCLYLVKGLIRLTKITAKGFKSIFIGKSGGAV